MRLMFTIAELGTGGAERIVVQLCGIALDHGHEVALAADAGDLDPLVPSAVERIATPTRDSSPAQLAAGTKALAGAIRSFRPDLLHAQNVRATVMTALASRLGARGRRPILTTFHGVPSSRYRSAALMLRAADRVACVSEQLQAELQAAGFPGDRTEVVPNAVEVPTPLAKDRREALDTELDLEGDTVVAVVGRLVAQKAHHRFIEAARLVADRRADARFLVIGDGPLRATLEEQARRADLEGRMTFTGVRTDARDLIARSDLIVFSSDWEGLSIAALEALAAGVPVISTPAQGMTELLGGGAGRVVAGFSPTELGDAITELLEDPARRKEMGAKGRGLVADEYSIARIAARYEEIWERLAKARPQRP